MELCHCLKESFIYREWPDWSRSRSFPSHLQPLWVPPRDPLPVPICIPIWGPLQGPQWQLCHLRVTQGPLHVPKFLLTVCDVPSWTSWRLGRFAPSPSSFCLVCDPSSPSAQLLTSPEPLYLSIIYKRTCVSNCIILLLANKAHSAPGIDRHIDWEDLPLLLITSFVRIDKLKRFWDQYGLSSFVKRTLHDLFHLLHPSTSEQTNAAIEPKIYT